MANNDNEWSHSIRPMKRAQEELKTIFDRLSSIRQSMEDMDEITQQVSSDYEFSSLEVTLSSNPNQRFSYLWKMKKPVSKISTPGLNS